MSSEDCPTIRSIPIEMSESIPNYPVETYLDDLPVIDTASLIKAIQTQASMDIDGSGGRDDQGFTFNQSKLSTMHRLFNSP